MLEKGNNKEQLQKELQFKGLVKIWEKIAQKNSSESDIEHLEKCKRKKGIRDDEKATEILNNLIKLAKESLSDKQTIVSSSPSCSQSSE